MFESAEVGHHIGKEEYRERRAQLRTDLLDAQFELRESGQFSVVILINGVDGAGKGETVNLLNKWMDPRHIEAWVFDAPSAEETERPRMWRYWRTLPVRGKIGVLFGNWYEHLLLGRVEKRIGQAEFDQQLDDINRFEAMLKRENVVLIKLWFHLSKDGQHARLKSLAKDAETRWRVTAADWRNFERYDRFRSVAEHALRRTSTGEAPWLVVDGSDPRYRSLYAARAVHDVIRKRLVETAKGWVERSSAPPLPQPLDNLNALNTLELDQVLDKKAYKTQLELLQGRLALLLRDKAFAQRSLVLVMEGADAAGKGGAIRRVTGALDVRRYRVVPIAAPTDEEAGRPYLWRFWRHVPRHGKAVIFDRSWYGRVLVERVEGFCSEADWMRAYAEINDFEDQLVNAGAVVVKFWLAISEDEQLARFKARENESHKRFKITEEDWRNRARWADYQRAVCDMLDRTGTEQAPWSVVEANNKYFARIKVLRIVCERLEKALER
jgi:polyphosphate:AMP phosphotransferase